MSLLYNILLILLLPALGPFILFKILFDGRFRPGLPERLGSIPEEALKALSGDRPIWFHAASVGEVIALTPVIEEFRRRFPDRKVLFSTFTATGNEMAKTKEISDAVIFLPLDYPFIIGKVVQRINPAMLVIMETELWPNLIGAASGIGAPVVMVNGRISDKSFGKYKAIRFLFRDSFEKINLILARTEEDRERFIAIGAEPEKVVTSGNIKFDLVADDRPLDYMEGWGEKVFVAGSTHPGEDEALAGIYRKLKESHPDLKMVLAPRHPERFDAVADLLATEEIDFDRRSKMGKRPEADLLLLDTMGELSRVYRYASVVFMGGSLAPIGGHNMLEPAVYGKPVLFGPYVDTFREASKIVLDGGGGIMVESWNDLFKNLDRLFTDDAERNKMGENARTAVLQNRGATDKTVEAISGYL